jgi:hypothetical protein
MSGRRGRIDREAMYRLLLEAMPSLAERWRGEIDAWTGDPRAMPDFPSLQTIASFAIAEVRAGNRGVVGVATRVMRDGDATARELMRAGILDDLRSAFPDDPEISALAKQAKRRR